ncbi:MAG: molybdopterin molybdotransferase MoeA [Nitrospirae bacterium]|nr:molybdopterin molybdotransferase MoeA [Nitrospirota bacterium]MBI3352580.1 molybdopterin molybdotransferase MoeA [Nitrospirota bacterium]
MMNSQTDDPIQTALAKFLPEIPEGNLKKEIIPLSMALHRVLAKDIKAPMDSPPYSRSIMEGYVVNIQDTESAATNNPIGIVPKGEIPLGFSKIKAIPVGTGLSVTTGSYIPPGDYAVIRPFDYEPRNNKFYIKRAFKPAENIETQGCDLRKGSFLLKKGKLLNPADIGLLASMGILKAQVSCKPKVSIFSSGNEVISPTKKFSPGFIWDSNSYALSAAVEEAGGIPLFKGIVKDDFNSFKKELQKALKTSDMILISGGTAVGGRDFVAEIINALGKPGTLVNGVPMRSGKPMVNGVVGKTPIVCVAGHPPEAMRGFLFFGKAAIYRLLGRNPE